ncbi:myotubularin-related protein [Senna tora]|uniref:Myotubularin-related protein n=1 Tax=Senna tora TaxID=362788 RepID=A0A834T801_9FABA|nr:myotubularin-related protein [Senna tora]
MMKGREREAKAGPSADLLVCFPSRPHLNLMPKPIYSPARSSHSKKRHHRLKKSSQATPILWAKPNSMGSHIDEPTSPKVTCAGQIKVTQNTSACTNWQSLMQEIEKIHNGTTHRKRSNWAHSLGFKREIMQFLTCLRSIRFDLRCFGSAPETDVTTEEDEEEELDEGYQETDNGASEWFMMLQQNQNKQDDEGSVGEAPIPPANALLLMRCRSAPARTWLKKNEDDEKLEQSLMEEDERKKEKVVVMRCHSDFPKISTDIVKETWIVGGLRDPLYSFALLSIKEEKLQDEVGIELT